MKRIDRSDRDRHRCRGRRGRCAVAVSRRGRRQVGFTLIELLVAITLLAIVALMSWRGFDQIVRGREIVVATMSDERALARALDQIGFDARAAATDDDAQGSAVRVQRDGFTIVRYLMRPEQPQRLQVIVYALRDGQLVRRASAPIATVGALQQALSGQGETGDWREVVLLTQVQGFQAEVWLEAQGWTGSPQSVGAAVTRAQRALRDPATSAAPLERAARGLRVQLTTAARGVRHYERDYPVAQ